MTVLAAVAVLGIGTLGFLAAQTRMGSRLLARVTPPRALQGYAMGSARAPIEILMFGDFECPACADFAAHVEPEVRSQLVSTGRARFRFVDFPLASHPNSIVAHVAAACAGAQGKFWAMHDTLYATQRTWSALEGGPDAARPENAMLRYAQELGLNIGSFKSCLGGEVVLPQIRANKAAGKRLGVRGTPTLMVGHWMLPAGALSYATLQALVDSAAQEHSAP